MKGLFIRKPIGDAERVKLHRHLGAQQLTSIGVGCIIGAGIFVITGQAAAMYAGPAILLSFVIAALVCWVAGLCYAELASIIPVAGGSYSYAYVAMGELPGWVVGWTTAIQYLASACTVAVGCSGYFVSTLRDFGLALPSAWTQAPLAYDVESGWASTGAFLNVPAIVLVAVVGTFVAVGIRAAARFNNAMVAVKLGTIIGFILLGLWHIRPENWVPFIPDNAGVFGEFGWSGVLRAAGLAFFAYNGFDAVATMAQETVNPQKNLARGILGSLAISTVAYLLTIVVLTGIVSYTELNVPDPMSIALNAMGKDYFWFAFVVKVAIIAALISVVLTLLLGQSRIFMAMSHDGLLPKLLGKVHRKTQTPLVTTVLISLFAMAMAGFFPVDILAQLVAFAILFIFGIVCLGVWQLRRTHPEYKRPFRVPFAPYVPILGALGCFGQMAFLPATTWAQFGAWLLLGLVVYAMYGYRHSKVRHRNKSV